MGLNNKRVFVVLDIQHDPKVDPLNNNLAIATWIGVALRKTRHIVEVAVYDELWPIVEDMEKGTGLFGNDNPVNINEGL